MRKIVINECFGGFGLSQEAARLLGCGTSAFCEGPRDDAALVRVVEDLGPEASSTLARLVIVVIPDDVEWHIHDYDGYETVHENHRVWTSEGEGRGC